MGDEGARALTRGSRVWAGADGEGIRAGGLGLVLGLGLGLGIGLGGSGSGSRRFYLYGGRNQGALVQLALNLRQRYPGVRIVGGYSPPHRPLTDEERAGVAEEINRSGADVVWVGIGVPKQEKWMVQMRPALRAPVLVGVGAAFDFHAGLVPQAPKLLQDAGLEWAYRLAHEPRRLWRRYLRYNPRFVNAFARQLAAHRRALRAR